MHAVPYAGAAMLYLNRVGSCSLGSCGWQPCHLHLVITDGRHGLATTNIALNIDSELEHLMRLKADQQRSI